MIVVLDVMTPLKEFKEWCKRRHPIVKDSSIILLLLLFFCLGGLEGMAALSGAEGGGDFSLNMLDISFIVTGFVVLFVLVPTYKYYEGRKIFGFISFLLIFPMLIWGVMLFLVFTVFWEILLLLLLLVGSFASITFVAWKLRKRKKALAWELEDQQKQLEEQLASGAITQEEYKQEKQKLLEKSRKELKQP